MKLIIKAALAVAVVIGAVAIYWVAEFVHVLGRMS